MHSKNKSHIVAALSLAHLASSCRGLRPLRFTASASNVHSVNNVRTTDTWPSLTATCNALSPSAFTASKLMLFYNRGFFVARYRYIEIRTKLLISVFSALDNFRLTCNNAETTVACPALAATCSAVFLFASVSLTRAPARIKLRTNISFPDMAARCRGGVCVTSCILEFTSTWKETIGCRYWLYIQWNIHVNQIVLVSTVRIECSPCHPSVWQYARNSCPYCRIAQRL